MNKDYDSSLCSNGNLRMNKLIDFFLNLDYGNQYYAGTLQNNSRRCE